MKIHCYHIISGGEHGYAPSHPETGVWEGYDLEIPDELIYGENALGEPILILDGQITPLFGMFGALSSWGGKPCLRWLNGAKERRLMLE